MGFGKVLRESRERSGLPRRVVSELADLHEQYIYEIETDKKNPSIDTVKKLAEAYEDISLLKDFIKFNSIDNLEIIDSESVLYEIAKHNDYDPIYGRLYNIVRTNKEALNEWTEFVIKFINKYEDKEPTE